LLDFTQYLLLTCSAQPEDRQERIATNSKVNTKSAMSSPNSITVGVSGMTCGSCVGTVTKAIENLGRDVKATVSLASGTAHVTGSSVTYDAVVAAVEACGFKAGPCGTSSGGGAGGKCSAGGKCEFCAGSFYVWRKIPFSAEVSSY